MNVTKYLDKANQDFSTANQFEHDEIHHFLIKKLKEYIQVEIDDKSDEKSVKKYIQVNGYSLIDSETKKYFPNVVFNDAEKRDIINNLDLSLFGLGVLEPLIKDDAITEIMVNDFKTIFIEKDGEVQRAFSSNGRYLKFSDEEELRNVIEKIVSPLNRKVNDSHPIVDARLSNGSRVNVVLNPIALGGSSLTIRKFPTNPFSMNQLVEMKALPAEIATMLEKFVVEKKSIIVAGGTGTGKTTFLNALSMAIPEKERVITVEDSAELKFNQVENLIRLETRNANIEGKGEITIRDLVKTSLRMRPDRIIVGEVRGGEAIDMLQAMNTGHEGSLSTVHANSSKDVISRLETMVLMSGLEIPVDAINKQIYSAIDVIVCLKRKNGKRFLSEVVQVERAEGGVFLKDLYMKGES